MQGYKPRSRAPSMAKYVIDPGVGLRIAEENLEIGADHELLAPTLFRSQVMSILHEQTIQGQISDEDARERLERVWKLDVRLLGDAVLRRTAWSFATQLGIPQTYDAEYFALTQLQGDAFITLNNDLARYASQVVRVASFDDLR